EAQSPGRLPLPTGKSRQIVLCLGALRRYNASDTLPALCGVPLMRPWRRLASQVASARGRRPMSSADWQNTPLTLPLVWAGLLCGWVAYVGWRRRAVPGASHFAVLMGAMAGWAFVNLVEKSLVNPQLRRAVAPVLYLFIVTVPGAWLVFAARFAGQDTW